MNDATDEAVEETATEETTPDLMAEGIELAKLVGGFLAIALVLRIFLFQPFTIPSSSMVPNLLVGDYIITTKFDYGYSRNSIPFSPPLFSGRTFGGKPKRGDVIVFKTPAAGHKDLIKRLIGLPGDRVQVRDGVVYINGQALPREDLGPAERGGCPNGARPERFRETNPEGRSYITHDCGPDGFLDNTEVYLVPDGHYFFMGDNRDNSMDSRVIPESGGVGYVPAQNLVAHARFILMSWKGFLNVRGDRFFKGLG